jgi:hypothetical protein
MSTNKSIKSFSIQKFKINFFVNHEKSNANFPYSPHKQHLAKKKDHQNDVICSTKFNSFE